MANMYRVYNLNGELIAQGTTKECAATLGITFDGFWSAVQRAKEGIKSNKYVIEQVFWNGKVKNYALEDKTAAEAWDAFVTPIRKKYGIPVYKAKPEVRG